MRKRLEFSQYLHSVLPSTINLYFQPPDGKAISYPAIVYKRNDVIDYNADNQKYKNNMSYQVLLICKEPDVDGLLDILLSIPYSRYIRHYVQDNLNHDLFEIFY